MDNVHDRMAKARNARWKNARQEPVERVPVTPAPEMIVKCSHCGCARRGQWKILGKIASTQWTRAICTACGTRVQFSPDYTQLRIR